MNWDAWKPLAVLIFTSSMKFIGGLLVAHGLATQGPGLEAIGGAATTAAGAFWSWWVQKGHIQAGDYLKKLTDTATQAAAIEVARRMPLASVTGAAAPAKAEAKAIEPAVMAKDAAKTAIILVLLAAGALAWPGLAHAQINIKSPQQIINDLRAENARLTQKAATAVGIPAADPATAVPCDFKMLIHLTPDNLLPTVKACLSDVNQKLVKDTQRALDSAHAYNCTVAPDGTIPVGCKGDGDAINCLTPALAIFKAGVQIPAQDEVPAVMSADGTTVVTPEKAAVAAQDPGPILLYQKYGEFTQSGALTACQTWFNKPITATGSAGIAGAGTIVAGAALLAPK